MLLQTGPGADPDPAASSAGDLTDDAAAADPVGGDAGEDEVADEVLVRRAVHGDPVAFERLLRRHQDRMFTVALRITGRYADAEDAAQNAFVSAWRKLPTFHGESAFATWLYRIVSNHALNQVRSRAPRDKDEPLDLDRDDLHPPGELGSPPPDARTAAMVRDLRTALDTLPRSQRITWVAREIDGLSYQEIAAMSHVGVDTVRGRLARARRSVAAEMAGWR